MKKVISIGLGVIIVILVILIVLYIKNIYDAKRVGTSTDAISSQKDNDLIDHQEDKEALLINKYHNGNYTIDHPYIITNPYNLAPLTALIMFKTDVPMQISITVKGIDSASDIHHSWSGYTTNHQVPVLGLYPNKNNTVIVTAKNKQGRTNQSILFIKTKPLPDDFLKTKLITAKPKKMEKGLTFLTPSSKYAYAVDAHGDVRWYSSISNQHVFTRLKNGNILFVTKKMNQYNDLLEMDLLGKVYNAYTINVDHYTNSDVIHHDAIELPNGNLLLTTHDGSKYIEDTMVEIDRKTGNIVHTLDMKKVLPKAFYENYDGPGSTDKEVDWFHQNAIWYDSNDHSILISSRHQDAILKMSYPDGNIKWILSDPKGWPKSYKDKLLNPVGNNFKFPAGQHSVMALPDQDQNKQTLDVLMFDNNNVISRGNKKLSQAFSRGVQYRINEKDKTVKEVWSYGEERGQSFYSTIVGDNDYLPQTGNRLITSGYTKSKKGMASQIVEVTGSTPAKVVFELEITGFKANSHQQVYRAIRLPLYPKKWNFTLERHHG
ncbi:aryl-sulfate sulfotransferase [Pullulanibacillus camelliae]|uniref:Aryl-sulfate sulfotransferase n=1 Tax=Pullulanibacillus camelliae TaxID=1707096 RepID=A0A8J2VK34_9BACL|nr:aryl-sulfate sulfotransferase [Pullulanibacillus camelliae]GGE33562.1 aryl-sulfate sulfotransferase [Pullulanibacillus camelliae]